MILEAPAKVNLSLRITGRREDGYHLLDTVFLPVSLVDTLTLRKATRFHFSCSEPSLEGPENLAVRAYKAMEARFSFPPCRIALEKNIPSQAGLGGGSSDAAAVLKLINRRYSLGLSVKELEEIAAPLGADVPVLLHRRPMHGLGVGEILSPLSCPVPLYLAIIKPPLGLSTPAMFRTWDEKAREGAAPPEDKEKTRLLIRALKSGDLSGIAAGLHNDFEAVLPPEAERVINVLREKLFALGAKGACMSGSGSAVFGLFETKENRDLACERLLAESDGNRIYACEGLCDGE